MNLNTDIHKQSCRNERAVALVITLLMLSVITFLAIAFLAITTRDKGAVNASLDANTARSMADAAQARATAGIIAQMMAAKDPLNYDYTTSHNWINPAGFYAGEGTNDPSNVNYDTLITNATPGSANPNWAQNIANLFWDPRPPVFVMTNGSLAAPLYDFRFWVDINRDGIFETNGSVQMLDVSGNPILNLSNYYNGEPEWIGVLKYPETNHSPSNPFIGRYAFMVLPIGKTLDWNFIHNYSKAPSSAIVASDNFVRDEGVGSWELNLAALLYDINTNIYQPTGYSYNPFGANTGNCFNDAVQFLRFRYAGNTNANYPQTLLGVFGNADLPSIGLNMIDEYSTAPSLAFPLDYNQYAGPGTSPSLPWPGSYNTNMFYDVQDLFDTNKTGPFFSYDLTNSMGQKDSYERYTFQRLLACIGTSSSPEYGVYVYPNFSITNTGPVPTTPLVLRTKVNINYDNTAQIQAGPTNSYGFYTPMPTNLVPWTPIGFFTNAAESLLRSQSFVFTNYILTGGQYVPSGLTNYFFGMTNIPVYVATNPGIVYNEQIHRLLQVAANIYAAAYPSNIKGPNGLVPQPPVFRPQFYVTNSGGSNILVTITNYVPVTNALAQISKGFYDLTNTQAAGQPDCNFWGIPWIIGAVTNIPEFDQYSYQSRVYYARKLVFFRQGNKTNSLLWDTTVPPKVTNQFYEMSVSNISGMDVWNPYNTPFFGSSASGLSVVASNYVTVTITNNYLYGTNINYTNFLFPPLNNIPAFGGLGQINRFQTFLQTTNISLPFSYFSEFATPSPGGFVPLQTQTQTYLPGDTNQTTYPTHSWTVSTTSHLFYALFDGPNGTGNLLDFVNIGPFGNSFPVTQFLITNKIPPDPFSQPQYGAPSGNSWWITTPAKDDGTGGLSTGALNQIIACANGTGENLTFNNDIYGGPSGDPATIQTFSPPPPDMGNTNVVGPFANYAISNSWMACDPLVHYTLGDLTWPGRSLPYPTNVWPNTNVYLDTPLSLSLGMTNARYSSGLFMSKTNKDMVFADPGMLSPNNWQFPTNLFPGVGWLGRVHRGTPWQTIFLKSDNTAQYAGWTNYWVNSPYTYPTNDWTLVDLFTAVPNDNAARGLLSVNQTNSAAWAAVFAGVIALTNSTGGTAILPGIDPNLGPGTNVYTLMDYTNGTAVGINQARLNTNYVPNGLGLFHHIGEILEASTLTVNSPFLAVTAYTNDEMVERIPQQTLSLLKVGQPQFVIYAWGQSLKPKNLYSALGASSSVQNICTNYEITGEFLTRTVCHVISDPAAAAPKIVVDSYNIEPGN